MADQKKLEVGEKDSKSLGIPLFWRLKKHTHLDSISRSLACLKNIKDWYYYIPLIEHLPTQC